MRRLLFFIVITAMGMGQGLSQTLIQTYTDRCTGATQVFSVPMNGQTVVAFYNKSRTFTAQDFQNGTLQAWLEETWLWWNSLSPCSTSTTNVVNTTQTTQQTTQQATQAATNATQATTNNVATTSVPTAPPPDTTATTNPTTDVTPPTTSSAPTTTEAPQTSTPDTSTANTSANTESQPTGGTDNVNQGTNDTGSGTSQETTTETQSSSEQTDTSSTETAQSSEEAPPAESSETTSTDEGTQESTQESSSESSTEESVEETSTDESTTEETSTEESTEETSSEETSEESSNDETDETTEESSDEQSEEESTEEQSEEESTEEESSDESEEESDESSEEESEEEETEEESESDEDEESEEEDSNEESDDETEEEDGKKKKKKRAFAAPVLMANVLSQQMPTGEYQYATMFGVSQTSLLGTETIGANLMVYSNLQQYMLNLNYSKVHINDEGRVNRVYSASIGGMKMFTTYMGMMNHSMVYMGKKGLVAGVALGTSITSVELDVREGYIYYDDLVLSGSLTGFATKPFKWNDRLTISPMLAVSNPFVTMSLDTYDTAWNTDIMVIGGSSFSYMLTQRFGLNIGVTAIEATIPQFPTLVNYMIGGRFTF